MYDLGVTPVKHNRVLGEWSDLVVINILIVRAHFISLSSFGHSADTRQTIGFGRLEVWCKSVMSNGFVGKNFLCTNGLIAFGITWKWKRVFF